MNKKIKAIAFDLDGLMVNTEDIYDQVCQVLLDRRGQQFSLPVKLEMMGHPGPVAVQIMKDHYRLTDTVDLLQDEIEALFHEIMPKQVEPLPGLAELLDRVKRDSIPACVATSSNRKHASGVLQKCNLFGFFDFVLTSEDVKRGKPHPEIYLLAAKRHGVNSHEMLILEDSVRGTQAGVASGSLTVAVPGKHSMDCDFSHVEHVAQGLADPLIESLLKA